MFANGKTSEIYKSSSAVRLMGWTPSGHELIVKSVESKREISTVPVDVKLLEIPVAGDRPKSIIDITAAYFHNIKLSPDRRTIAYVSRPANNDMIQTVSLADKRQRTVIESNDPRVYYSSLAYSPDSKALYYGKQANWHVVSMVSNFK